jgi:hypothetical protein
MATRKTKRCSCEPFCPNRPAVALDVKFANGMGFKTYRICFAKAVRVLDSANIDDHKILLEMKEAAK